MERPRLVPMQTQIKDVIVRTYHCVDVGPIKRGRSQER